MMFVCLYCASYSFMIGEKNGNHSPAGSGA